MSKKKIILTAITVFLLMVFSSVCTFANENDESIENVVSVEKLNSNNTIINLAYDTTNYNGNYKTPVTKVMVKVGDTTKTLVRERDYTVTYSDNRNAGRGKVTITGKGEYEGTVLKGFSIKRTSFKNVKIKYRKDLPYTKKKANVITSVTYRGHKLRKDVDYKVTYTRNKYPGKGTFKIVGIGNYKGYKKGNFTIAKVKNFKNIETKSKSVKVSWSMRSNVSGYRIYKYHNGKYILLKDVKGSKYTRTTLKNLKSASTYSLAIRTYKKANGKTYFGEYTKLRVHTRPSETKIYSIKGGIGSVSAKWNTRKGTGYQVVFSTHKDFSRGNKTYTLGKKYNKKTVYNLKRDTRYYVRVRTIDKYKGKTRYSKWSTYKSIVTDDVSVGWNTIIGRKYYYDYYGHMVKGQTYIGGKPYYFDSNGQLRGASQTMWEKVKNRYSNTNWLLITDTTLNKTCIYERISGEWVVKKYLNCTTGAYSTPTVKGTFSVTGKGYYFGPEEYTCWYYTQFYGDYLYHSVIYKKGSQSEILDGRLGMNLSHGCVRLTLEEAKWIYDNIPYGTKVIIY